MPELTIILPVHDERENIAPLLAEIEQALDQRGQPDAYEVIAVDDGSNDGSGLLLQQLAGEKAYLKVICFRQNYGQSAAFDAGFRHASGRIVITMDADGQNDPADLPAMIELIERDECDFVIGRRVDRHDRLLNRKLPSRIANFIIRLVTRTRLHDLGCSLKVYRRELTEELHLYGEMHRFLGVLVESLGARTIEVPVNHRPRTRGRSKYGLTRTFKVLLDLLTIWFMRGYQTKPIYIFGGTGLLLGGISTVLLAFVAWQRLVNHIFVHLQPTFTIAMIFSVMAVQFLVLGLLAEIMVRTYFESQGKSGYLIRSRIGFEELPAESARPAVEVTISSAAHRRVASRITPLVEPSSH